MSMQAWVVSTVQECCEIVRGVSFPSTSKAFSPAPGTIACLRTTNVQKEVQWDDLWFIPRTFVRRGEQILKPLDILISLANSYELVGKVALVRDTPTQATLGAFISAIRCDKGLSPKFVYYQLSSLEKQSALRKLASTTTNISNISTGKLADLSLFIAPRKEQERLVEKIEELLSDLDAGVAALERARANLKRYRAAVLKAAVEGNLTEQWRKEHPDVEPASKLLERILAERRRKWEEAQLVKYAAAGKTPPNGWKDKYPDPARPNNAGLPELPKGWCWATVDQVASLVRNGLPDKPASQPPGFPILRINAVRPMSVDVAEIRYLNKTRAQVSDFFLDEGDLLFTRYNGSIDLLGVSGMVRNVAQPTLHPDKLIRVTTVLRDSLPDFVEIASNVGVSRAYIQAKARTTAGQTGVSGTDIKETPIPLCPIDEQRVIIEEVQARLSVVAKVMSDIQTGIAKAGRLRQSILKRAFEGKLVPQDPNDEPASLLLERIRTARSASAPPARNGRGKRIRAA